MAIGDHLSDVKVLWGSAGCADSNKCLILAAEKGVDINGQSVDVNSESDMKKVREFSPYGLIPVLKDVDFYVFGTTAILSYLDDKGFGNSVVPRNGVMRAQQYQWVHIANDVFAPIVQTLKSDSKNAEALQSAKNMLGNLAEQLALKTKRGDYIVGDFSLADVHWAPYIHFCCLYGNESLIDEFPAVKAWWGMMKSRKSTSKEDYRSYTVLPSMDDINNNKIASVSINN